MTAIPSKIPIRLPIIRKLAKEGYTKAEIARRSGIPYDQVLRITLRFGITCAKFVPKRTAPSIKEIEVLRYLGYTYEQIGQKWGQSKERIRQRIKTANRPDLLGHNPRLGRR